MSSENLDLDAALDMSPQARVKRFLARVINTRYLLIAILIHVVALILFGGKILFDAIVSKGLLESQTDVLVATPPGPPPPPPSAAASPEKTFDVKVAAQPPNKMLNRIATDKLSETFNVPPPDIPMVVSETLQVKTDDSMRERIAVGEVARLQGVRGFLEGGVEGGNGKRGATGKGRATVAKFTCYVAQYVGGDWDCNFGVVADNRWYSNCIYNLMLQIERWSQGKVKANLKPEALKLSSREWIDKIKPPFIFITGHKDFVFTASEVDNLREYLMLGGALWVDNSLPGRRSRFDLALRRELKKVLPDRDFEPLAPNHPVYTQSYFNLNGPPQGMNFYQEPTEVIKIGGEVAVFYTLNAYSDLWETGLTAKDEIDTSSDYSPAQKQFYNRMGPHFTTPGGVAPQFRYEFFRNVNQKSIVGSYQFGINIVIHLLTRFQDKFSSLPRGT